MPYYLSGLAILPLQIHLSIPSSFVSSKHTYPKEKKNHCFNLHHSFTVTITKSWKPPMTSHILKEKREGILNTKANKVSTEKMK